MKNYNYLLLSENGDLKFLNESFDFKFFFLFFFNKNLIILHWMI